MPSVMLFAPPLEQPTRSATTDGAKATRMPSPRADLKRPDCIIIACMQPTTRRLRFNLPSTSRCEVVRVAVAHRCGCCWSGSAWCIAGPYATSRASKTTDAAATACGRRFPCAPIHKPQTTFRRVQVCHGAIQRDTRAHTQGPLRSPARMSASRRWVHFARCRITAELPVQPVCMR